MGLLTDSLFRVAVTGFRVPGLETQERAARLAGKRWGSGSRETGMPRSFGNGSNGTIEAMALWGEPWDSRDA